MLDYGQTQRLMNVRIDFGNPKMPCPIRARDLACQGGNISKTSGFPNKGLRTILSINSL